jgi:hypothetical protein
MRGLLLTSIFMAFNLTAPAFAHEDMDIAVSKAWVAALPPTQTTTAAYMTIENKGKDKDVLISATTPVAAAAEIHQMSDEGGMMKMAMLKSLTIPAMGKVVLGQGGYHLMLINLVKPLKKGDIVPIYLKFDCGCTVEVKAIVGDGPDPTSSGSSMSNMSDMAGMKM